METEYVHAVADGNEGTRNALRELHDAGFESAQIDVMRRPETPAPPLVFERRHDGTWLKALAWGTAGGALSAAPFGMMAPGVLQQVPMRPWFDNLVSQSVGMATLESLLVGGVFGAVLGLFVGLYRVRPADSDQMRFHIGVHTTEASAERAARALRRSGLAPLGAAADPA